MWRIFFSLLAVFIAYRALKISELALQANDSPRLFVVRRKSDLSMKKKHSRIRLSVELENLGSSRALTTFMIVKFDKNFYLSRPIDIMPNEMKELGVEVPFDSDETKDLMEAASNNKHREKLKENLKCYIISTDFFGNRYNYKVKISFDNSHLTDEYKPFQLIKKYGLSSLRMSRYKLKAKLQGHTYADRLRNKKNEFDEKLGN